MAKSKLYRAFMGATALGAALLICLPPLTAAPEPAGPKVTASRFEFEVIESYDAKYLGDTPAHHGRNGGLGTARPKVFLDDPVYRGETVVGHVTAVVWDRVNGGLNIEFDPAPMHRISVGDVVWIRLDGSHAGSLP